MEIYDKAFQTGKRGTGSHIARISYVHESGGGLQNATCSAGVIHLVYHYVSWRRTQQQLHVLISHE
jgi:hypothetical protein